MNDTYSVISKFVLFLFIAFNVVVVFYNKSFFGLSFFLCLGAIAVAFFSRLGNSEKAPPELIFNILNDTTSDDNLKNSILMLQKENNKLTMHDLKALKQTIDSELKEFSAQKLQEVAESDEDHSDEVVKAAARVRALTNSSMILHLAINGKLS